MYPEAVTMNLVIFQRQGTTRVITFSIYQQKSIERELQNYFNQFYSLKLDNFKVENVSASRADCERFIYHASENVGRI